ncbi:hypothetical protein EON63_10770 [archaeon]|nr:MAG: hypothetical protein EON63_10770 [archaeon]
MVYGLCMYMCLCMCANSMCTIYMCNMVSSCLSCNCSSGSSLVPLRVEGIKSNVLLDYGGLAQREGKLAELLCGPDKVQLMGKEDRLEWRRSFHKQNKDRKKK